MYNKPIIKKVLEIIQKTNPNDIQKVFGSSKNKIISNLSKKWEKNKKQ